MRDVVSNKITVDTRCDMILKRAMLHVMLNRVIGPFLHEPLRRHLRFLFYRKCFGNPNNFAVYSNNIARSCP